MKRTWNFLSFEYPIKWFGISDVLVENLLAAKLFYSGLYFLTGFLFTILFSLRGKLEPDRLV
jgi:hypothetical protein